MESNYPLTKTTEHWSIEDVWDNAQDSVAEQVFKYKQSLEYNQAKERIDKKSVRDNALDIGFFRYNYLGPGNELLKGKTQNFKWYRNIDKELMRKKPDGTPFHRFVMILLPPGWGKSYGYSIGYSLQQIATDRTKRILILSKASRRAGAFMKSILHELQFNDKLMRDFGGPFYSPDLTWNTEDIKVVGSEGMEASYSISHQGFYSQVEGARPNLIICDDPLDMETAMSQKGVKRFQDTFLKTVVPRLEPNGQLLLITHRFAVDDGLQKFIDSPMFQKGNAFIIPALDENGNSTNPLRYPEAKIREEVLPLYSTSYWETAFMQNPIQSEECPFEGDWILPPDPDIPELRNRNADKWVNIDPKYVDLVVDPSFTKSNRSDYTGAVALGPHPTDKHGLIIMAMWSRKISSAFTDWYMNTFELANAKTMYIEVNNAQTLKDAFSKHGFKNYELIHTNTEKAFRIGELETCFKATPATKLSGRKFRFYFHINLIQYKAWETFLQEVRSWTPLNDSHDHILDALGIYVLKKKPWSGRNPFITGGRR